MDKDEVLKRSGFQPMGLVLLGYCVILGISACSRVLEQPTPTPVPIRPSPSSTVPPTATNTSVPTHTASPTVTPTPGPQYMDDQRHPSIDYTLPLTLQYVGETMALVYFEINLDQAGCVFYWAESEGPEQASCVRFTETSRRHLIRIDGLEKDKNYSVAVGLDGDSLSYKPPGFGDQLWAPITFRTLDLTTEPIRVGVIGDSGFGHTITEKMAQELASADLDFLIHTGDVVYLVEENSDPYEAYSLKYYQIFSPVLHQIPIYPVIGNHEFDTPAKWEELPFYTQAFPPLDISEVQSGGPAGFRQFYALSFGPTQILFLDSQAFYIGAGPGEQTEWIRERLALPFKVTVIVLHVPPFSSGFHPNDGAAIRRTWVPLFEQANVELVLSGHDHNYQHLVVNDIDYVISGGGSAVLYAEETMLEESKAFIAKSHYLILELYRQRIEVQAVSAEGEILDSLVVDVPE
jgi:hypothetical protein